MTSSICNVSDFHSYVQNTFLTEIIDLINTNNFAISHILIYFSNDNAPIGSNKSTYFGYPVENVEIRICFIDDNSTNNHYFTLGSFDCALKSKDTTLSEHKAPKKIRDKAYKIRSKLLKYFSNALIEIDTTIHNFNN